MAVPDSSFAPALDEIRFALRSSGLGQVVADRGENRESLELVDDVLREAATFAANVFAPINAVGDREGCRLENGRVVLPSGFAEAYRAYVAAGWSGVGLPSRYGGQQLPVMVAVAVAEMFNAANMALSTSMMACGGAVTLIDQFGSDAQKRIYLPKIASGEWPVTMVITEPQAGSEVGAIQTRAVQDGSSYRIRGQKAFISFGEHDMTDNIVHLVLARSPGGPPGVKGLSLYLVPRWRLDVNGVAGGRNDITCIALEHKMGLRGSPTATLVLGERGGAHGELLGVENKGLEQMFVLMNRARLNVGVFGLASAERARQAAVRYALERVQGRNAAGERTPILFHPDVRRMLLSMTARTEATRLLAYYTASLIDLVGSASGKSDALVRRLDLLTPITKAWCTETAFDVSSLGVQIFGGMGYSEECEASQHFREARVHMIYEGTTGVQANDLIFRKIQRDGGKAAADLFGEVRKTLGEVSGASDDLDVAAKALSTAVDTLEELTKWIVQRSGDTDSCKLQANAAHYLMLFGACVAGWLSLRAASMAARDIPVWGADFATRKARNARFFMEQVTPPAAAMVGTIMNGAEPILGFYAAQA